MFKQSKRKIVAAILSILVLLLAGTLCVIYAASYIDMTNENQEMLRQYVQSYTLPATQGIRRQALSGRTRRLLMIPEPALPVPAISNRYARRRIRTLRRTNRPCWNCPPSILSR